MPISLKHYLKKAQKKQEKSKNYKPVKIDTNFLYPDGIPMYHEVQYDQEDNEIFNF
jgi:hypothetical protein